MIFDDKLIEYTKVATAVDLVVCVPYQGMVVAVRLRYETGRFFPLRFRLGFTAIATP